MTELDNDTYENTPLARSVTVLDGLCRAAAAEGMALLWEPTVGEFRLVEVVP